MDVSEREFMALVVGVMIGATLLFLALLVPLGQ